MRIAVCPLPAALLLSALLSALASVAWTPLRGEEETPQPLAPTEAARTMRVPDGFQVKLFAGEPDVVQPIGFCVDDRGRLWVAEAWNYPHRDRPPRDRIVILEDADGDGQFDRRQVFYDQLNYVAGIEVGFGGAWVMSPPYFYFIPDRDGDDRPDAPPQVLLDGFGDHANAHNMANGFAWGPDGWLYATHGRTNWSLPAKPGTPLDQRVQFDGGVWRYHPQRHVWEPFADGTTNPWGIDFDDYGQGFVCNCVNPHLFHVIQGAHYEPWRNRKSSQYAYQRIDTIADHLHYLGGSNVRAGLGSDEESDLGGGHAHCGTLVYLGDNFPAQYRNTVLMNNIHGHRINNDRLRRHGSGYIASHAPDLMRAADPWYMGVTLQTGPDGGVFASDWSDTGECHSIKNTQVGTGRIYKITYGRPAPAMVDVARLGDLELVELQRHANDWYVRHARRVLQERAAAGRPMHDVHLALHAMLSDETEVPRQLRALWALHVTGGLEPAALDELLNHGSEYLRAWAIRLLTENGPPPAATLERFQQLAANDSSAFVRLHLASALQRIPAADRWPIAASLAARSEDQGDMNLPLMIWYGIEPLVDEDLERFVRLAATARIPLVGRHVARRAASHTSQRAAALKALLGVLRDTADDPARTGAVLAGVLEGLEGLRRVEMPESWPATYQRLSGGERPGREEDQEAAEVAELALQLALVFDDPRAFDLLRQRATQADVPPDTRQRAIQALITQRDPRLAELLVQLVGDPPVRQAALRGLAEFDHPRTVETILTAYPQLDANARQDALQTLAARPAWAHALLDAINSGQVPRNDLTAFTVRQLHSLGDARLSGRIAQVWGDVRATSQERARLIRGYQQQLAPETLAQADLQAGRAIYQRTCANCHKLFGEGGQIGPEITGSQRTNLQYLLENIVDPSAAVAKDYQIEILATSAGRVITGLVVSEDDTIVTVQTQNEKLLIPVHEIEARRQSPLSLMPDGLLQNLSARELRDLFGYLVSQRPVAPP
ncbi:MAG: c-type cytochrome [Pirellulaceae bacterium]|nr:c-type cytochrome [Pirellulaceae bacterium]